MNKFRAEEGTFRWMLEERIKDELRNIAKIVGRGGGGRKDDIIDFLLSYSEESKLLTLWNRLDDLEQKAVSEALYSVPAQYNPDRFFAKYSKEPNWGNLSSYYHSKTNSNGPSLLYFFMPFKRTIASDMVGKLKKFVPKPKSEKIKTVKMLPECIIDDDFKIALTINETERTALLELPAVLRLIDQGKISVSDKKRVPTASAIKNLTYVLNGNDFYAADNLSVQYEDYEHYEDELEIGPIRPFAWPVLLQAAKFVQKSGSKLKLAKTGKNALKIATFEETIKMLFDGWSNSDTFDEFIRVNNIKGQTGRGGKRGLTAPSSRKMAICDALADCPVNEWISLKEFSRFMVAENYLFEVTENPWALYICDSNYGSLGYEGYHNWNILQGRYIKTVFMEYLATLGIIDIAYIHPADAEADYRGLWGTDEMFYLSRYDGLLFFRLTRLGAYCLELADSYTPPVFEEEDRIKVLSNFDIAVTGSPLPPADNLLLTAYTEKKGDSLWKISREKLFEAYEKGHTIDDLRKFLTANSSHELPKTVDFLLDEAEKRCRSLKDKGSARLIECATDEIAMLIASNPKTGKYCLPAGNGHIAVFTKDERKFQTALRQLGYAFRAGI